ncbi:hypothetical protein P7E02_15175 [Enterococcus hulanensis]|uniref:hypothetical protein n=1 Tax=Enterococcus hulanensis TaxID=2559929 RepID=UPI00288F7952|nr:hypothetical protein [Enterococcus hulanensis]MDT2661215.1 hypothetical protein [Enterococcus hulanensis]
MLDVTSKVNAEVSEVIIPSYYYDKLDTKQLSEFLKEIGLSASGSKETKVYKLFSFLKKQKDLSSDFKDSLLKFFLEIIKYTNNRITIEVPIKVSKRSPILKKQTLLSRFDTDEKNFEINHILQTVLSPDDNPIVNNHDGKFNTIYRHASYNQNNIDMIELAYVRNVEYSIKSGNSIRTLEKYEFVWCEIDVYKECLRIFISNNRKTADGKQLDGSIHQMKEYFTNKLSREFDFKVDFVYDGQTLFKIYRELTSKAEIKYSNRVSPYNAEIEKFVDDMKKKLKINNYDDIDLTNRIIKLFERNLIQKDFEKLRKDPLAEGRVVSLDFQDGTGSSVKATTGGMKNTEDGLVLLDMQDSDVYFDTKETIHSLKVLGIIVVEWNAIRDLPLLDERYQKPKVTYIAYKDYYVCSVQRVNLNKEVSDYVLSKFDRYRDKSL